MIWWGRVHLWYVCLAATVVCVVAGAAAGDTAITSPSSLLGVSVPLPLSLALPVLTAALLLFALDRGDGPAERAAVRPVREFTAAALGGLVLMAVLLSPLAALTWDAPLAPAAARNLAGSLGTGLIVRQLLSRQLAPAAPIAYVLLCTVVGVSASPRSSEVYPYAWPFAGTGSLLAWVECVLLFAVGVLLFVRKRAAGGVRIN